MKIRRSRARGRTIAALAAADPPSTRRGSCRTAARLLALPGIGPWTADYLRMRATGDPDVLLASDLAIRNAADDLGLDLADGRPGLGAVAQLRDPPSVGASVRPKLGGGAMIRWTLVPSPLGELFVARDEVGLTCLYLSTGRHSAEADAGWVRDDAAFDDVRTQLSRVLRRHPPRIRPAAAPDRHRVPAAGLAGAVRHPVRRDGQLRLSRRPASARRTRSARSVRRTGRTRSRSSSRAIG